MNDEMTKHIFENIVQDSMMGKDEMEYIVALVFAPEHKLSFLEQDSESKEQEEVILHNACHNMAVELEYRLAIYLAKLRDTEKTDTITAERVLSDYAEESGKESFAEYCQDSINSLTDIGCELDASGAATAMAQLKAFGFSIDLKDYYVIVLSWKRDDIGSFAAKGVNLHRRVKEILAGT